MIMKSFTLLFLLVCIIVLQSCSQSGNSDKVDQKTINKVTELLTRYSINWANAIKEKDASEILDYFAPDFMYQAGTGERIFRDEFIKGINENLNTFKTYDLKDVEVTLYGPALANVTGGETDVVLDSNGKEQTYESRFTNVWRNKSGKWQCIIGHGNPLQNGEAKPDTKVKNELLQVWKDFIQATNSGDIDKLMTFFTDDYVNMPSFNSTQSNPEELKKFMKGFLEASKPNIINYQQIETYIHSDIAYEFGNLDMYNNPNGGQKMLIKQRCITVYKKNPEGKWKLYRWMGQD